MLTLLHLQPSSRTVHLVAWLNMKPTLIGIGPSFPRPAGKQQSYPVEVLYTI